MGASRSGAIRSGTFQGTMDSLIAHIEAPAGVLAELHRGEHARRALAGVRQERVNAACRAMESRLMDGIGQLTHRIDADVYWLARMKHGANCWSDPAFVKDCEKKGMIQRVAGRSDKIMVDIGRNVPIGAARTRRVDLGQSAQCSVFSVQKQNAGAELKTESLKTENFTEVTT